MSLASLRAARPGLRLWAFLAATLLLRALVPQGYMPASDNGELVVRLCGSDASIVIPRGDSRPSPDDEGGHRVDAPCAFAGLAAASLPPPTVAALPAPQVQNDQFAPQPTALAYRPAPVRLPPARGPPLTA